MGFANKIAPEHILRAKHDQVNLINFYKPQPPYWIHHFEFFKSERRSVISDPKPSGVTILK